MVPEDLADTLDDFDALEDALDHFDALDNLLLMSFLIHHLLATVFNIFMSMLSLHACRPLKEGNRVG